MQTEALSVDAIAAQLDAQTRASVPLTLLASVDSTNAWCLRQARQGMLPPHACLAQEQTRGRGRRGRQWQSPAGCSVYLSLLWRFAQPLHALGLLPLAAGLAVHDCLHSLGIEQAVLKWPNDVLVNNRKIAGVLVETAAYSETATDLVIGVGLNFSLPADVMPPGFEWTDIGRQLPASSAVSINTVAGKLLRQLVQNCQGMQQREALWQRLQPMFATNQPVEVVTAQGQRVEARMLGITGNGELQVLIDGSCRVFNSADISLRSSQWQPPQKSAREAAIAVDD